jgi:hypothetical protein
MHPTSTNQTNSSSACTSKVTQAVFFDAEEPKLLVFKTVKCYKSYILRSRTNVQVKSLWHGCAAHNAHLFMMQSSGPTKCHAVEGVPACQMCHLAIKENTFVVDNGVQESRVQWFKQQPKEFLADMPTSTPAVLLNASGDYS